MPRRGHIFKHIYVRHHCEDCGSRCFPFDKYEAETQSPIAGVKRPSVLLKSYNATISHRPERLAWCWSCGGFRTMRRVMEDEILAMYLTRRGVGYRNKSNLQLLAGPSKRRKEA